MNWELIFNLVTALLVMALTWWIYHSDGFPDGRMVDEERVGLDTFLTRTDNFSLLGPRHVMMDTANVSVR